MDEPQKIRKLKKLSASEVSLVSRGAIRRPFLVIKNEQGAPAMADGPQQQFLLTPEQDKAIDGVLAKHQLVAKGGPGSGPHPGGGGGMGGRLNSADKNRTEQRQAAYATAAQHAEFTSGNAKGTAAGHRDASRAHAAAAQAAQKAGKPGLSAMHEKKAMQHTFSARQAAGVKKADDGDPVQDDALRENIDVETGEDAGGDEGLDARSLAALKAVYRILQPFKGQITEDMVDDVLAELDLDGTGEDGQDSDEDDIDGEDDVDDGDDTLTEDDQAMADNKLPDEFKKADTWSPSKPDGMSDEDFSKAVAAAKSAFNNIGKKADNESDDDGEDDNGKVSKSLLAKLSPEHAALVRKSEDARYEAIAKAAALESRVAKMEGERILKAHEDDIRKDCIVLGKDPVEQARILKSQFEANKEAGEHYRAILRDTARLTQQSGILKSVGTSHNSSFGASVPSDGQGSPKEQMDAMLRSVVQKGEAADEAAAWAVVMKSQRFRDLYEADRKGIH